jgi:hypothetical protein
MPMPPSGMRKFARAILVVKMADSPASREILIQDLSWDVKNTSAVEKTDGAVGIEDDASPADVTASWQVKIAQGGLDYLTRIITPGKREVECSFRTADGQLESWGVLQGASEKQPQGTGHNRTITFAGVVTAWVPSR